jgi:hypothetical protein
MHLVQFDARQIRQPHERGFLARNDIVFFLLAESDMLEPVRRPLRAIFLIERLSPDAIRKTNQRQRPPFDLRQNRRRDFEIVFD